MHGLDGRSEDLDAFEKEWSLLFKEDGKALVRGNDGLVGFRRVGGLDGAALVPDLATSIPVPTDGGRTQAPPK